MSMTSSPVLCISVVKRRAVIPELPCHKSHNAFLHLFEVSQRLRDAQHHAGMPYRMYGHGGCGHNETAAGRYRQRNADGMPSSQHQGSTGLADTGNQFGQRQPRFHIPAPLC